MKMRKIDQIVIPAQSQVTLKPGGLHIMLFDLQQNFTEGSSIDLMLHFKNGENMEIHAPVKAVQQGIMAH